MKLPEVVDVFDAVDRGGFEKYALIMAIKLALSRDDLERAKRYAAFAVAADSQSTGVMEAAGDYLVAAGNASSARNAYDAALRLSPGRESVTKKIAALDDGE